MAAISAFSALASTCSPRILSSSSLTLTFRSFHYRIHGVSGAFGRSVRVNAERRRRGLRELRAVDVEASVPEEEEGGVISEQQGEEIVASSSEQPTVTVPVSPSDILTMFFQAEGTMNELAIPNVTKALEASEGITNLKVQVEEGIASVELTKQTTVQATGVASGLVETIQGSGFKLQTLNLSFQDREDVIA